MKSIRVKYYASLREQASTSAEVVETTAITAEELFIELKERHGFTVSNCQLRVSVNNSFSEMSYELKAGDELVYIPPVAGG